VSVLLGNGNGTFQPAVNYSMSDNTQVANFPAGLLGLVALACNGSAAHAQMMRGGRMGGMMMGGMREPFMAQFSPMVSPTMGAMTGMGGFNPGVGLFQPRMVGSSLNLGTGLTNFGVSGLNTFGNGFAMPFRAGYGMGGYGMVVDQAGEDPGGEPRGRQ
jgi:hypothetical protein